MCVVNGFLKPHILSMYTSKDCNSLQTCYVITPLCTSSTLPWQPQQLQLQLLARSRQRTREREWGRAGEGAEPRAADGMVAERLHWCPARETCPCQGSAGGKGMQWKRIKTEASDRHAHTHARTLTHTHTHARNLTRVRDNTGSAPLVSWVND